MEKGHKVTSSNSYMYVHLAEECHIFISYPLIFGFVQIIYCVVLFINLKEIANFLTTH